MDVVNNDQVGTTKRMRDKVVKICSLVTRSNRSSGNTRRGLRDTSQAVVERERIQRQVRELEQQLATSHERERAAELRIQETQAVQERLEQIADEELSQAEERAHVAEKRSHYLERRSHDAEQRSRNAEQRLHNLEQQLHEAEQRATVAERRLHAAEERVRGTERRAWQTEMQLREDNHWLLERREIELTEEEVGRGGWAVVRVANFRETKVAAKCFYQHTLGSQYNRQLFSREMNMAARLRHPNLVQFIGASLEGEPIILTELMTTSLRAVLEGGPINRPLMTSISLDVARALNYLHLTQPQPIIHRDISSANVLLDPLPDNCWRAKVSDYGSVNILQQLQTVGPGSPAYAAPEASTPALQSPKMDIFSFGVLLVEMLTDQFPEEDARQHLIALIDHDGFGRLVRLCVSEDRDQRPSASDLITEISDMKDDH